MLTDLGIPFLLRQFKYYDGVYIPAKDENDNPIVGINLRIKNIYRVYRSDHTWPYL